MPLSVLIAIGFLAGWCASHLVPLRDEPTKKFLAVLATLAGLLVAVLAFGEALRWEWAYKVEELLVGQRLTPVLLAMLGGVVVYLFRTPIRDTLGHLRDIALVPEPNQGAPAAGEGFKGVSFPWYVSVGLFLSIAITAVLAFNPQILKHITTIKAAGLEADFTGGSAAVQRGQMSILDPNRKSTVVNWATFEWPKSGSARYETYFANDTFDRDRFEAARTFFETKLSPVFKLLACFDRKSVQFPLEKRTDLRRTTTRLAERIRSTLVTGNARSSDVLDLGGYTNIVEQLTAEGSTCEHEGIAASTGNTNQTASDPWDPYVIEAVGDLLLLTDDRGQRERFFAEVTGTPEFDHSCKGPCAAPTAGQLSLAYAVVDAEVQSDRPWPFDKMIDKLSETMRGIDVVLGAHPGNASLQNLFRRNRLIDLTLGLQLFDQRVIAGYPLKALQRQIWREWLEEVRHVLALDEHVGSLWPPPFDEPDRAAWRAAKGEIDKDPALVQDAAIGTALSLVLLHASDDSPSAADCLAARSAFHFAKDSQLQSMTDAVHFDRDDKATYSGLLEQMEARLESECGR